MDIQTKPFSDSSQAKVASPLPIDWENIDATKDWIVGKVNEPDNPYADPFIIRGDLVFKVSRFGYTKEHILDSIINNKSTH